MNQRPQGLNVTKAIAGFLQYKSAAGPAPVTESGYERDLNAVTKVYQTDDAGLFRALCIGVRQSTKLRSHSMSLIQDSFGT